MSIAIITQPLAPSPIRHPGLAEVKGFPRPRYKGHWAIGSRDLPATDRFYAALTGTQTICRPAPFSTAVSWDEEHHRFFIIDMNAVTHDPSTGQPVTIHPGTPQERTGVGLASIGYASPAALVAIYDRMQRAGWVPERIIERGRLLSLVYRDPNELLVEAFATLDEPSGAAEQELSADSFLERFG